ncbi:MAG TPA: hypothetical protein VK582_03190 [Pyrinomonadaceae bacterium]|nr:hypothetical protein [Pyrinomonadaceae bacterium]
MENQEKVNASEKKGKEESPNSEIEVQVERFQLAKPKFSKEAWDSGEGSSDDGEY